MSLDSGRPSKPASGQSDETHGDVYRMSFGDHLEELRVCLILALLGVGLATVVCLGFGKHILAIICRPLWQQQLASGLQPNLQVLAPTAAFSAYLKIGFLSGMILAMPWVLWQIWKFVGTGLYRHERRFLRFLVPASGGLFIVGVMFLYFIVLPIILRFFIGFNQSFAAPALMPTAIERQLLPAEAADEVDREIGDGAHLAILSENPPSPEPGDVWVNVTIQRLMVQTKDGLLSMALDRGAAGNVMNSQFAIDYYVSFVLILALAFGIAFETPIVVFFLAWTGIMTRESMAKGRRYVLLGSVVLAAVLTPPDVISQLLLAGPMYLLFEVGLVVARIVERKRVESSAG